MLKILFRIGMILLAAAIVAGGLYLYANSAGSSLSAVLERPAFDAAQPPSGDSATRPMRGPGGEHGAMDRGEGHMEGGEGFSLANWSGLLMQTGKVALITLVVVAIQAIIQWIRRRQHPAAEQAEAV